MHIGKSFDSFDNDYFLGSHRAPPQLNSKPFLCVGEDNKFCLVDLENMSLLEDQESRCELTNIHESVFADWEDLTGNLPDPNTCVIVGGDDVIKYDLKNKVTLGVLPHALIREKIYYSTY
jgi:hypothetical protein